MLGRVVVQRLSCGMDTGLDTGSGKSLCPHISQQEFVAGSDGCREKRWLLWAEHTQPLVPLLLLRSPGETAEAVLA